MFWDFGSSYHWRLLLLLTFFVCRKVSFVLFSFLLVHDQLSCFRGTESLSELAARCWQGFFWVHWLGHSLHPGRFTSAGTSWTTSQPNQSTYFGFVSSAANFGSLHLRPRVVRPGHLASWLPLWSRFLTSFFHPRQHRRGGGGVKPEIRSEVVLSLVSVRFVAFVKCAFQVEPFPCAQTTSCLRTTFSILSSSS